MRFFVSEVPLQASAVGGDRDGREVQHASGPCFVSQDKIALRGDRAFRALTSRLIFLAGVNWSCLRINKPAFPLLPAVATIAITLFLRHGVSKSRSAVLGSLQVIFLKPRAFLLLGPKPRKKI